jgi:DNA-binding transcriptional regulator/RsmH inhibitor MraZ
MVSESNRSPRRICLSIHVRAAQLVKDSAGRIMLTAALATAKEEYDRKWKRPAR